MPAHFIVFMHVYVRVCVCVFLLRVCLRALMHMRYGLADAIIPIGRGTSAL